jgi:ribosomal protein S8
MSQLKELLGDLYTPEIEAKIGKTVVYLWNKEDEKAKDQEPIPKFRVNEMIKSVELKNEGLTSQITALDLQVKDYDKQLKDLKKAAEGNTELVNQITELQNANKTQKETFEAEKTKLATKFLNDKKHLALLEDLGDAEVYDPKHRKTLAMLIENEIGLDKIELDEKGKWKNSADIIKRYKEDKSYELMFGKTVARGQRHNQGDLETAEDYFSEEQLNSLTKEQLLNPKIMEKADRSYAALRKQ